MKQEDSEMSEINHNDISLEGGHLKKKASKVESEKP